MESKAFDFVGLTFHSEVFWYFDHREKPVAFLNFDRPLVGSWSWKVSANYFVWLIPSHPNRRKDKQNIQPCFFSEMLVLGGSTKAVQL